MQDGGLTFRDLVLRLAEALNIALYPTGNDNRAQIPADPNRLDKCKRFINDGAREFLAATRHPYTKRMVSWNFTAPVIEHTFATGTNRVRLLASITSAPRGSIRWRDQQNGGGEVYNIDHSRLLSIEASKPTSSGPPLYCSVVPARGSNVGERPGMDLAIFPKPDRTITLSARYRLGYTPFVDMAERGFWGADHDLTVLAFAVARAKAMDMPDEYPAAALERDRLLAHSMDIDAMSRPRTLGTLERGERLPHTQTTQLIHAPSGAVLLGD